MELRPIKKWVDDHLFFRYASGGGAILPDSLHSPFTYAHGLIDIYKKSCPLKVPWHPKKWRNFAFVFTYLSFLWDLLLHTVTLLEDKHQKYRNKLVDILNSLACGKRMSCNNAMSINGTLSHIAFVIPHSCAYLANLLLFISEYPSKFTSRHPHALVILDLKWWFNILEKSPSPCNLVPHGPPIDIDLWVNLLMEWGIGIILGDK